MMYPKFKVAIFSICLGSASLLLAFHNLAKIVEASCFIGWSVSDPTCVVAYNSDGNYQYDEKTQYASVGNGTWDLRQLMSDFSDDNTQNQACSPTSVTVVEQGGSASGTFSTHGVEYTHAETSDRPGYFRLYYFHPQDYPELYRHERVARERAKETSVKIHQLLNPD